MCLILLAYRQHPDYALVVAANRDEFYERPSLPAHLWEDAPEVLAGRDLRAGGTWLGVTRTGRFAAVTNVREPGQPEAPRSRGELPQAFLLSTTPSAHYAARIEHNAYAGFNLLHWDGETLYYSSNRAPARPLPPGIYGLSNASLDSPWPKVETGVKALERALSREDLGEALLDLLEDRGQPPDEALPDTGVGLELERLLAPCFIRSERYGTRASTALLLGADGHGELIERNFDARGPSETRHHRW